jgi:hypothetical protein
MLKKRFFKTKQECEVTFEYAPDQAGSEADEVELLCEANGWEPVSMRKTKDGSFRAKMRFPKEREFEFLYRVDHKAWVNDDDADGTRANGFGGRNSVLDTNPAG